MKYAVIALTLLLLPSAGMPAKGENTTRPLVTTEVVLAGTPAETKVARWDPAVESSLPAPFLVYDRAYLRGRVATETIPTGRFLLKQQFRNK